jgi:sugar-phosphatase
MTRALPCRGLLFDADGVLVDSDASVHLSWSRWARKWRLEPDSVTPMVHGRRSADTVALLIDPADRQQALADIDGIEIEDAASVTTCPGAIELLATLPPASWAVVTSGTRALATARFRATGLPVPRVLVTADDVVHGKPDPTGYRMAADALRLRAEECVVFEDSPAGVAAGLSSGAAVVGVTERALDSAAPIVVRDLAGLRWDRDHLHIPPDSTLRIDPPRGKASWADMLRP